jgi:hypothetical protein
MPPHSFPATQQYFGADDKFFWIDIFASREIESKVYIEDCLYIARLHATNYSNDYKELSLSCLELWAHFKTYFTQGPRSRWMKRDIRIQRFIIGDFNSPFDNVKCLIAFLQYKVDANSFIRFSIKKIKTLISA